MRERQRAAGRFTLQTSVLARLRHRHVFSRDLDFTFTSHESSFFERNEDCIYIYIYIITMCYS